MRTIQQFLILEKLKGILKDHDIQVADDGRTFALIHGRQVSRHTNTQAVAAAALLSTEDERIKPYTR